MSYFAGRDAPTNTPLSTESRPPPGGGRRSGHPRFNCVDCPRSHPGSGRGRAPSQLHRRASATRRGAIRHVAMREPTGGLATRPRSTRRLRGEPSLSPTALRRHGPGPPHHRPRLAGPRLAAEAGRSRPRPEGIDGCDLCCGRPPRSHRQPGRRHPGAPGLPAGARRRVRPASGCLWHRRTVLPSTHGGRSRHARDAGVRDLHALLRAQPVAN